MANFHYNFKTSSSNTLPFMMWNLYTGSWWTSAATVNLDCHWQRRVLTAGGKTFLVVPVDLIAFYDFEGWRTEFRKFNSSHLTSSRLLSWKFKLVYAVCYILDGHFESINYNYTLPVIFFLFIVLSWEKNWLATLTRRRGSLQVIVLHPYYSFWKK